MFSFKEISNICLYNICNDLLTLLILSRYIINIFHTFNYSFYRTFIARLLKYFTVYSTSSGEAVAKLRFVSYRETQNIFRYK